VEKIKVLLSSRPKLLSEVFQDLIAHQPDMEMVGELIDPIALLRVANETMVDVVIVTPLGSNEEPRICRHMLAAFPLLKIVTLSAKGETAYLYQSGIPRLRIDEPSGPSILGAIREALRVGSAHSTHERSHGMGDKGKKDRDKNQKQKSEKKGKEAKAKKEKNHKGPSL
jgi:DNA-binding NarL/FixJ family response regulator